MTKLNWRDASKELPKECKEYLIQVKYGDTPSDNFCMVCSYSVTTKTFFIEAQASDNTSEDYFYREIKFPVLYWSKIPLPEE